MKQFLFLLMTLPSLSFANNLNVLIYHHVSDVTPASTSITAQRLEEHLQYLNENQFNIVDLKDATLKLQKGIPLPKKSVAITFDDGFANNYTQAWPILQKYNAPFTIFINAQTIDDGYPSALTWSQVKAMHKAGVSFSNHAWDHQSLVKLSVADAVKNIEKNKQRLKEELGIDDLFLAYPFGDYSIALKNKLKELGYIAYAQQSGGISSFSDFQALPRFPAAGIYSNLAPLKTKLNSTAMPVDYQKTNLEIRAQHAQPNINVFLLNEERYGKINCFINGEWQKITWLNKTQFSLSPNENLNKGQHRYNCTSKHKSGNYFWYSHPLTITE